MTGTLDMPERMPDTIGHARRTRGHA